MWITCPSSDEPIFVHHRVEDAFPLLANELLVALKAQGENVDAEMRIRQTLLQYDFVNRHFQLHLRNNYTAFKARPCSDKAYAMFIQNALRLQEEFLRQFARINSAEQLETLISEISKMLPGNLAASAEIGRCMREAKDIESMWRDESNDDDCARQC